MSEDMDEGFEFDQFKRNIYFQGKLLTVKDFDDEQDYFRLKNQLNNKYLQGEGIVYGLKVSKPDSNSNIKLSRGFAIDSEGNEIIVSQDVNLTKDINGLEKNKSHFLYIWYFEEECDEFPSLCAEKDGNQSRMKENFKWGWVPSSERSSIKIAEIKKDSADRVKIFNEEKKEIKSNLEISKKLNEHSDELNEHSKKLNEHSKELSEDYKGKLNEHKETQHFGNKNSIVTINNLGPDEKGNFEIVGGNGVEIKTTGSSIVISFSTEPPKDILYPPDLSSFKTSFDSIRKIVPQIRANSPSKGFLCKKIDNTYLNDILNIVNRCNDFFPEFDLDDSYFTNDIESSLNNIEQKFEKIDSIFLNKDGKVSTEYYDAVNKHNEINSKYLISNKERDLYELYLDFISVYNQDIYMKKSNKELHRYNMGIEKLNNIIQKMLMIDS